MRVIDERPSTDRWPQRLPLKLIGVNYECGILGLPSTGYLDDRLWDI
ncbi:hypothetical protein BOW94_gp05 [Escherichia phage GA2A]|uniref:Uncharacterized protein n=1 Tax=Escherichia phage GA2A TaxID=1755695 RepID=A0A1B0TR45_9CAUD|nr:hypothetical protein BOW94_gp05 [Escherichia phage GA2A]ALP47770.1 hypothetical protein GA2A_04A [Escherichia phage GA2A]